MLWRGRNLAGNKAAIILDKPILELLNLPMDTPPRDFYRRAEYCNLSGKRRIRGSISGFA